MKRSTLVAFAVLVLLVGIVYWLETDDGSSADVERVFDVSEEAIERVEIRRTAGEEPVVVGRDGEGFRLLAPLSARTDEREIDLVLSNLATMTVVRAFARDESTDLAEYGLDAPKLEVRFVTSDGGEHAVRFGNDTLTPSNQYAERSGSSDVLVVASHVGQNLDKSAWDLRDKAIFRLPEDAEPERVTVVRRGETIEIENDAGVWMTASGPRSRVDRFAVTGMVARFRRAEMLDLVDGATLDPPVLRLDVAFQGGVEAMTLEIGDKQNVDYLARVPGREHVFLIEGGLVDELDQDDTDWWSRKLLHHATTEMTVVRITTSGEERSMDRGEAQELLKALSDTTAEEVVTEPPSGDPNYVITVTTDDAEDEIMLHLAQGKTYATRKDEDVVLVVPAEAWTAIQTELQNEG